MRQLSSLAAQSLAGRLAGGVPAEALESTRLRAPKTHFNGPISRPNSPCSASVRTETGIKG